MGTRGRAVKETGIGVQPCSIQYDSRHQPAVVRLAAMGCAAVAEESLFVGVRVERQVLESADPGASSPVVMIELAPAAVAPEITPNDKPPDQVASRAEEPEIEPEPEKPI